MLGYLEQAAAVQRGQLQLGGRDELAGTINSTVSRAILNTFLCPSDGLSPQPPGPDLGRRDQQLLRLRGHVDQLCQRHHGVYAHDTTGCSPQGARSYGLQDITDGSSNTIAFGESLVGDGTIELVKWRDGPVLTTTSGRARRQPIRHQHRPTVSVSPTSRPARWAYAQPSDTGRQNQKGFRWAQDDGGFGVFNTVVPPNSTQFPSPGVPRRSQFVERLRRGLPERQQQPPRRGQFPVVRRQRALHQASIASRRTGRWGPRPTARSSRPIRIIDRSSHGWSFEAGPASSGRLFLLLVPLLPDLAAGGVEAEQGPELGVGLRRLAGPQVALDQ